MSDDIDHMKQGSHFLVMGGVIGTLLNQAGIENFGLAVVIGIVSIPATVAAAVTMSHTVFKLATYIPEKENGGESA